MAIPRGWTLRTSFVPPGVHDAELCGAQLSSSHSRVLGRKSRPEVCVRGSVCYGYGRKMPSPGIAPVRPGYPGCCTAPRTRMFVPPLECRSAPSQRLTVPF